MHSCVHCTAELFYDRGNHYKFTSLVRELDTANVLMGNRVSVTLLEKTRLALTMSDLPIMRS
jgi:hypothetical protein